MKNIKLGFEENRAVGLHEFMCPHCKHTFDFKLVCDVMGIDAGLFYGDGSICHDAFCPNCKREVTLLCDVLISCEMEE